MVTRTGSDMPRLIKKKYSQRLGEGDADRVGDGGEVRHEEHLEDVDSLLKKQRLLLMSGKLPTLTPRTSPGLPVQNPVLSGLPDTSNDQPASKIIMNVESMGQSVVETKRDSGIPNIKDKSGGDVSQHGQRYTVELGEEPAAGFRRCLSSGTKRAPTGVDSVSFPGASSHHRVALTGAKKAMRDRLAGNSGQRSEVQHGSISGQFNDGLEKETSGSFTKMKIMALNDSSSDDSESEVEMESSKEAQEAEAYALYNKALELQRSGDNAVAEATYKQLLSMPLLAEVEPPEDNDAPVYPGLMLKYSTFKNLGSMAYQKQDLNTAIERYVEAVELDDTDVMVWYRMGTIATTLLNLPLARLSFMEALKCSPRHWPSLDNLCTVLYALNDYATCLYYICQALERDGMYRKGVVLREKMFKEQPSLRKDSYDLFRNCQDAIPYSQIDKAESERIHKEALTLREQRRALGRNPPRPLVKFLTPFISFASFTWKGLGERLIELYDHLANSPPPLSKCCKIDMSEFEQHPKEKDNTRKDDTNRDNPVDIPHDTSPTKTQTTVSTTTGLISSPLQASQQDIPWATQETSQQTPQQTPEQTPEQTLQQMPEQTHTQTPQQSIQESTQQSQQYVSQQTTQQTTQQTPQQTPQQTQERCSDIDDPVTMETEPVPVKRALRRGPKRKRDKAGNPALGNRRSTRVRNTAGKKKEESVNYQEILRQFLPSSLQDSGDGDDIEDTECTSSGAAETSRNQLKHQQSLTSNKTDNADQSSSVVTMDTDTSQSERVWSFLAKRQRNSGVIAVLDDYLKEVATTLTGTWPAGLTSVFLEGYKRSRGHLILPNIFSSEYTKDLKTAFGYMMLIFAELKIDQLISTGKATPSSASKKADVDAMGAFFEEDLTYMMMLTTSGALLEEKWRDFTVRVNWLKARYMTLQGKSADAVNSFDVCADVLSEPPIEEGEERVVLIPNCTVDNRITVDLIEEQVKSTQHCQSVEEVQRLYEAGNYERVTSLLLPALQDASSSSRKMLKKGATPQRPSQLLLLHRSLLKLNNYKQCVVCGAASIVEALQEVSSAKTPSVRDEWITVIIELFTIINKALSEDVSSLMQLERSERVRFTTAVISIVEMCMDTDSGFPQDVLPWVVLYRLIKHEEDQIASKEISVSMVKQDGGERSITPMIPSSLMLLDTAHDCLGRRSWCCNSNGAFLRLYISVLYREISMGTEDEPHPFLSDLQYSLEQCFFCLHGHPSKKTKARHLQDHGVDELPMDLDDASIIFDHFKPSVLPEFDSYKTSSMSADLESLLLKIVRIIPPMEDPPVTMEMLQSYIEAKTEEAPSIPKDRPIVRPVVKEIYYLLADFYFKNKEFFKAIKLYMQDICVCPDRLDSWAGMALARSGRLEQKLNTCDSKTEGTIYKHSVAALRCFQRALEIDRANRSLWIEYGSMAYMMHSHASRQLKQKEQFSLTEDIVEFLQEKRSECLSLAEKCFEEARQCEGDGEEEEWLVHYMLGKVAEKRQKDPLEFLQHYKQAAFYLHEDEAKYPKKIAYHNPPDLSLEALEMYFRLHASILKLLEKPDEHFQGDYSMLERYVLDAVDEPFVTAQEKMDTSEPLSSADNDPDTKSPIPTVRASLEDKGQLDVNGQEVKLGKAKVPGSPLFVATPTDHDYVRSRNRKRQLGKKTDDSSEFPLLDQPMSSSPLHPSQSTDATSGTTSASELLKSLAKIHSDILDQPPPKKRHLEHSPGPEMDEGGKDPSDLVEPQPDPGISEEASLLSGEKSTSGQDEHVSVKGLNKETQTGPTESGHIMEGDLEGLAEEMTGGEDVAERGDRKNEGERLRDNDSSGVTIRRLTRMSQEDGTMMFKEASVQVNSESETSDSVILISSEDSEDQMEVEQSLTSRKEMIEIEELLGSDTSQPENTVSSQTDVITKESSVQVNEQVDGNVSIITISSEDSESQRNLGELTFKEQVGAEKPEDGSKTDEKETMEGEISEVEEGSGDSKMIEAEKEGHTEDSLELDKVAAEETSKTLKEENSETAMTEIEQKRNDEVEMGKKATTFAKNNEEQEEAKGEVGGHGKASDDLQDEGESKMEAGDGRSTEERRAWLMERCLEAMKLCLARFPQHYKSLYRMANAYSLTPTPKSLQWSRDLLLGSNQPWQQTTHMPSPGLFAEHWKTKNLFHGVWRIPISEIDRSGSFSWHMYRSVSLLIDVLRRLRDHAMLLQIAVKLNRTPELGKKFLRDVDRQYLAKFCYKTCLEVLEEDMEAAKAGDKEQQLQAVLASYRLVQTAQNKLQTDTRLPTRLLCHAYRIYKNIQVDSDVIVLDQAVRFCLQHRMASKTPQTPTSQPESIFSSPQHSKERNILSPDRYSDTLSTTPSSTQ